MLFASCDQRRAEIESLKKSAAQGNADAQCELGAKFEDGAPGVDKDLTKAAELFQQAAAQGHPIAQCRLGAAWASGRGVPKDDARAVEWFQKAAAQGNHSAQWRIGAAYEWGRGVPQDYVEAYAWYHLAAKNQHPDAAKDRDFIATRLTPEQQAEARKIAEELLDQIARRKQLVRTSARPPR